MRRSEFSTLAQVGDEIVADLEKNLEYSAESALERIRQIIAKWDKHIEPGSEWHAQECCVADLVEELKKAVGR